MHDQNQHPNEDRRAQERREDDVHRIQLRRVRFQIAPLAHSEERPHHRFHRLGERALAATLGHTASPILLKRDWLALSLHLPLTRAPSAQAYSTRRRCTTA